MGKNNYSHKWTYANTRIWHVHAQLLKQMYGDVNLEKGLNRQPQTTTTTTTAPKCAEQPSKRLARLHLKMAQSMPILLATLGLHESSGTFRYSIVITHFSFLTRQLQYQRTFCRLTIHFLWSRNETQTEGFWGFLWSKTATASSLWQCVIRSCFMAIFAHIICIVISKEVKRNKIYNRFLTPCRISK